MRPGPWRFLLLFALPAFSSANLDVFRSGESGYNTYRIPALAVAQDGTLLAFAEGRRANAGDPGSGDIDLVLKRSTDNGASWGSVRTVDDPGEGWAASNPTPVLDRRTGRIWLAYNRWRPGRGTMNSRAGTDDCQGWLRWSDDNGQTWSAARDITREARDFDNWTAMFFGPGGAIQTRTGRLVLPAAMCPDTCEVQISLGTYQGRTSLMRAYAIYSDDGGKNWQRGRLLAALTDENQMVELSDGALMMDARQAAGPARWLGVSADGGATWSRPRQGQTVTAVATAIERWGEKRLLWTGPEGPGRLRLVARVSTDEGQTFDAGKVIYGGIAAYSDIAILKDGSAGVLWERGVSKTSQYITFTRLEQRDFHALEGR